jgi:hypothetical protein
VLPFALLAALVCWQLALTGHTAWLVANAARVAARAEAVGRDGPAAARSALPKSLEHDLKVNDEQNGAVTVRVHVPILLSAWRSPLTIAASASLAQGQ